jgi:hypothetical protein
MPPTLCSSTNQCHCKSTNYPSSVSSPCQHRNKAQFFNRLVPPYSCRRSVKKQILIACVSSIMKKMLLLCHNLSIPITLNQCYLSRRWHLLQNLSILAFPVRPTSIFHIPSQHPPSGARPWRTTQRLFLSCNV